MKIMICTTEYPPNCSGIGNVVRNVEKQLKAKGHKVEIVNPKYKIKSGKDILNFWKKCKGYIEISQDDFDIIWCHNPLFMGYISNDKIICTTHTTYNGRWKHMPDAIWPSEIMHHIYYRWMNAKEKQAYKFMKSLKFTVLTEQIGEEIKELGIDNYTLIPNGVDTEEFILNAKKKEQCCAATRLVKWKRVDRLVKQFNEFGYPLKIAGDGPLLNQLKKEANSNIEFLGKLNKAEMIKLFGESRAYVSTSEYEGMPLTLLESMSCGCLPLVTPIPGHKEIIEQLGDVEDPEKINDFVKENYSWDKITEKYLEVFENDTTN